MTTIEVRITRDDGDDSITVERPTEFAAAIVALSWLIARYGTDLRIKSAEARRAWELLTDAVARADDAPEEATTR